MSSNNSNLFFHLLVYLHIYAVGKRYRVITSTMVTNYETYPI